MAKPGIDLDPRRVDKAIQRLGLSVNAIASSFAHYLDINMQPEAALKAIGRYRRGGRIEEWRADALCRALEAKLEDLKPDSEDELGLWLYSQSDTHPPHGGELLTSAFGILLKFHDLNKRLPAFVREHTVDIDFECARVLIRHRRIIDGETLDWDQKIECRRVRLSEGDGYLFEPIDAFEREHLEYELKDEFFDLVRTVWVNGTRYPATDEGCVWRVEAKTITHSGAPDDATGSRSEMHTFSTWPELETAIRRWQMDHPKSIFKYDYGADRQIRVIHFDPEKPLPEILFFARAHPNADGEYTLAPWPRRDRRELVERIQSLPNRVVASYAEEEIPLLFTNKVAP